MKMPYAFTTIQQNEIRKKKFFVIGSVNVDFGMSLSAEPIDDGSAIIHSLHYSTGGHAGNCAHILSRLGGLTWIFGGIGRDQEGNQLLEEFQSEGIQTDWVFKCSDANTGRVFIPSFPNKRYMLMNRGANEHNCLYEKINDVDMSQFDYVFLFDPPMLVVERVMENSKNSGVKVVWNPGGILTQEVDWVRQTLPRCQTFILNQTEAKSIFKNQSYKEIGKLTDGQIIITQSKDGARLITRESHRSFSSHNVDSIDETGAGDAFTAGIGLLDSLGYGMEDCVRIANVLGALITRKEGPKEGTPGLNELKSWIVKESNPD